MPIPRIMLDEKKTKEAKEKEPRRVSVKNASFFLFKRNENRELAPMGGYETEAEIRKEYEDALDQGDSPDQLVGIKGRYLEFTVTDRRITVR